jgi:hypothetical protein
MYQLTETNKLWDLLEDIKIETQEARWEGRNTMGLTKMAHQITRELNHRYATKTAY